MKKMRTADDFTQRMQLVLDEMKKNLRPVPGVEYEFAHHTPSILRMKYPTGEADHVELLFGRFHIHGTTKNYDTLDELTAYAEERKKKCDGSVERAKKVISFIDALGLEPMPRIEATMMIRCLTRFSSHEREFAIAQSARLIAPNVAVWPSDDKIVICLFKTVQYGQPVSRPTSEKVYIEHRKVKCTPNSFNRALKAFLIKHADKIRA